MKLTYLHQHIIKIFLGAFLILSAASCRKELPQIDQPERYIAGSFSETFQAYWTGMNNSYVFWDIDPTNWDDVHRKYQPLFARLNVNDSADVRKSYTYFKEMTAKLVDSHYTLVFNSPYLRDSAYINPSGDRHEKDGTLHNPISANFFYNTIPQRYLGQSTVRGVNIVGNNQVFAIAGKINNNILYLHFNVFSLKTAYDSEANAAVNKVLKYYFDNIQNPAGLKGLIIDVRSNSGGALADLNFLLGPLTDQSYSFGSSRSKAGMGRLEYTPWVDAKVTPAKDAKAFTAPVIVLADINSISMAEITTMAVKSLPSGNGKFVGERTWGANGPLIGNDFLNGGQFSTGFFNLVYTSSVMLRAKDGKVYEGIGFPPDVESKYNAQALAAGRDIQLEKAISLIP